MFVLVVLLLHGHVRGSIRVHLLLILLLILLLLLCFSQVYHISNRWWYFTVVLVTSYLVKSREIFLVFWSILIMLYFGWSPIVLLFPSYPVPVPNLLVIVLSTPLTTDTTVTFMFHSVLSSLARSRYFCFFSLSFGFTLLSTIRQVLFFFVDNH